MKALFFYTKYNILPIYIDRNNQIMLYSNHSVIERLKKKVRKINPILETSFFTPTAKLKELTLLQHIEKNPDTTQKEMAQVIGAAPSMVNVYINEYEEKGYIIREYISQKVVKYRITTEGLKRKNYLVITYLHELLKLYRLARENVENFLDSLINKGYKNVLLYGAGEVAETILGIVKDRKDIGPCVVALIDDDSTRENEELLGYKIIPRDDIEKYDHDAIVITSYTFEDDIRKRLEEVNYPGDRVVRFFSE